MTQRHATGRRVTPIVRAQWKAKERVMRTVRDRPPESFASWRSWIALALAVLVHAAGLTVVALGVQRIVVHDVSTGVLLLLIAAALCPWWPIRVTDREEPADLAVLHQWVDGIARDADIRPPDRIVVASHGTAATWRGVLGTRWLSVGPELFALHRPVERDAVIAHELGHWSGRRIGVRLIVWRALHAIERPMRWTLLIRDDDDWAPATTTEHGRIMWAQILLTPFVALHWLISALVVDEWIGSELVADRHAATLTGTEPMVRVLEVAALSPLAFKELRAQAERREHRSVAQARQHLDAVPAAEIAARTEAMRLDQYHRGGVHPPFADRIAALRRWPITAEREPDDALHAALDRSMLTIVDRWAATIANRW